MKKHHEDEIVHRIKEIEHLQKQWHKQTIEKLKQPGADEVHTIPSEGCMSLSTSMERVLFSLILCVLPTGYNQSSSVNCENKGVGL